MCLCIWPLFFSCMYVYLRTIMHAVSRRPETSADLLGMELQKDLSDYIYMEWESKPRSSCWATLPCPWGHYLWRRKAFYNFTSHQTTAKPCFQERGNILLMRPHFILNLPSAPETLGTPCIFLFSGKRNAKLYYFHEYFLVSPGARTRGLCLSIKSLLPRTLLCTQPVGKLAVQSCLTVYMLPDHCLLLNLLKSEYLLSCFQSAFYDPHIWRSLSQEAGLYFHPMFARINRLARQVPLTSRHFASFLVNIAPLSKYR